MSLPLKILDAYIDVIYVKILDKVIFNFYYYLLK